MKVFYNSTFQEWVTPDTPSGWKNVRAAGS